MNPRGKKQKSKYPVNITLTAKAFKTLISKIPGSDNETPLNKEENITDNSNTKSNNNDIEKKNLTVQYVLASFTILLFILNSIQTFISNKAVDQAIRANNSTDTVLERSKIQAISDSIRQQKIDSITKAVSDSNFLLQKRSIDAQIASLKQTNKNFDIENRPFVQIGDFTTSIVPGTKDNNFIKISYRVVNFGKLPAEITSITYGNNFMLNSTPNTVVIDSVKAFKDFHVVKPKVIISNVIAGGYPINQIAKGIWDITLTRLKSKENFYYIFGKVHYRNPITHRKYIFNYIYRMYVFEDRVDIIQNSDKEIK